MVSQQLGLYVQAREHRKRADQLRAMLGDKTSQRDGIDQ
jgi:hypothetical protein